MRLTCYFRFLPSIEWMSAQKIRRILASLALAALAPKPRTRYGGRSVLDSEATRRTMTVIPPARWSSMRLPGLKATILGHAAALAWARIDPQSHASSQARANSGPTLKLTWSRCKVRLTLEQASVGASSCTLLDTSTNTLRARRGRRLKSSSGG